MFKEPVDRAALLASDWYAHQLVGTNRDAFFVPEDVPFRVEPRLDVTKSTYRSDGEEAFYGETIIKVSWKELEGEGRSRWVRFGTTLVLGEDGWPQAIVTSNPKMTGETHADDRERLVEFLFDNEFIAVGDDTGQILSMDDRGGLRLKGTGRCLHTARAADAPIGNLEDL